jgi:hypothetical protein
VLQSLPPACPKRRHHALGRGGAEIEIMSITNPVGTTAIDLTGNEFDNTITATPRCCFRDFRPVEPDGERFLRCLTRSLESGSDA